MLKIKKINKIFALLLMFSIVIMTFSCIFACAADESISTVGAPSVVCKSAILMEASTGQILYEQNADEALPPASVTKIMTLLLVMEAIENGKLKYDDVITASAYACSMGGSQIYLKEGEQMRAEDMIKSVVISSANDAAVALAEHIAGSESAFVSLMNARAKELGMTNTNFENTNGLDDTAQNHVTSARDIAIMSRELIKHKKITEFSSIWMDTIRNGEFGLTNTNRLVRFFKGATGLKTGSTAKAGFCISATAERNGMSLICVIMGSETRDIRNASATSLLDWGFANYTVYRAPSIDFNDIKVTYGKNSSCSISSQPYSAVIDKKDAQNVKYTVELPQGLAAPIKKGDVVGKVRYSVNDVEIACIDVVADCDVEKIGFKDVLLRIFYAVFMI